MGKKSRNKGKVGEREAAKLLSELLGVDVIRGVQFQGGKDSADLAGLKDYGLHPEVKRDESTVSRMMYKAFRQATSDSGGQLTPFVLSRRNRCDWVIGVEAKHLIEFCSKIMEAYNAEENV